MESIAFQSRYLFQIIFQQTSKIKNKVANIISLKEYLISLGEEILDDPQRLNAAKEQYKKSYMKAYKKAYNQENKRVKLSFKLSEYQAIQKAAAKMKKPVATYIKENFEAYQNSEYILPDEKQVLEMNRLFLNISNNVNQISRYGNENRFISADSIKYLYQQLREIKSQMDNTFKRPENLLDVVEKAIENNPFLQKELLNLLSKHNEKSE
jgi:hypothetical protein